MEPNPMVAKPSRRRRRATTGDLSAVFEETRIGSYEAVDASEIVIKPRRQLSVRAEPGPRRTASLGPSQFAEASKPKPRVRRATTESFKIPKDNFGAADSPRRSLSYAAPMSHSLSQGPMGDRLGWAANGDPPKRTSSRRSSNDRAPSQELRRSNSFDSGEGRRGKKKPREKLGAVEEEEEVVAMKPSGSRPRRRRATTGDLGCNGAAHDAAGGNNGDDEGRDNETAKMQAVIAALQVLYLIWPCYTMAVHGRAYYGCTINGHAAPGARCR